MNASFSMLSRLPQLAARPELEEDKILTGHLVAIVHYEICIAIAVAPVIVALMLQRLLAVREFHG